MVRIYILEEFKKEFLNLNLKIHHVVEANSPLYHFTWKIDYNYTILSIERFGLAYILDLKSGTRMHKISNIFFILMEGKDPPSESTLVYFY